LIESVADLRRVHIRTKGAILIHVAVTEQAGLHGNGRGRGRGGSGERHPYQDQAAVQPKLLECPEKQAGPSFRSQHIHGSLNGS
jgi:hypothetical protein